MNSINKLNCDAVIFDLDGVVTNTTNLHIKAWKKSLNSFLSLFAKTSGVPFTPMSINDYKLYIDGKQRYDGVESFLKSRQIAIPHGRSEDKPGFDTVCAIGNLKNDFYISLIDIEGAEVYSDAIFMINKLRAVDIKTAVVSASKNCYKVLYTAGIFELFDVKIDGNFSEQNELPGKPEPDVFLSACKFLETHPGRTAIVEDSAAGIMAGRKGNFSFIIGVSRDHSENYLYQNGATVVVSSLTEIPIEAYES